MLGGHAPLQSYAAFSILLTGWLCLLQALPAEHDHSCIVQGCTQCGAPEVDPNFDHGARNRLFKFWVSDRHGDKLDYARATTLVYTLGLAFGGNLHGPINAPGSSFGQSNNYN